MSAALRELLERACEAYLYSQMRDDRFTAAEWMGDAFSAAGIPVLLAEAERLRAGIVQRGDDMIVPAALLDEINATGAAWKSRAEIAEAALLAQSAAYEALVARCSELAAKLDRQAAENYTDRGNALSRCADDIRLLVSDDRPSHTAGENDA